MLLSIQKINPHIKSWYSMKLKRIYGIFRSINILISPYLKKLRIEENRDIKNKIEIINLTKDLKNEKIIFEKNKFKENEIFINNSNLKFIKDKTEVEDFKIFDHENIKIKQKKNYFLNKKIDMSYFKENPISNLNPLFKETNENLSLKFSNHLISSKEQNNKNQFDNTLEVLNLDTIKIVQKKSGNANESFKKKIYKNFNISNRKLEFS